VGRDITPVYFRVCSHGNISTTCKYHSPLKPPANYNVSTYRGLCCCAASAPTPTVHTWLL